MSERRHGGRPRRALQPLRPETRKALRGVIRGFGTSTPARRSGQPRVAVPQPARSSASACSRSSTSDTPLLATSSSPPRGWSPTSPTASDDLAGPRQQPRDTTGAIGRQEPPSRRPSPRSRRSCAGPTRPSSTCAPPSTTSTPLVDESKPVGQEAAPVPAPAAPAGARRPPDGARPLRLVKPPRPEQRPHRALRSTVPLRDSAIGPVQANGKQRDGAFPASTKALSSATPELELRRARTPSI